MNTKNAKKANKKAEGERQFIELTSFAVDNVRVIDTKNGDMVLFTAELNGIKIYNCRVATGKNGDFISFPQYKGTNGNYYNNVYAPLSDDDTEKILADVQKAIDNM